MFTLRKNNKIVSKELIKYLANPVRKSINYREFVAGGYPDDIFYSIWKLVDIDNLKSDSNIAVINDIGLEATWQLVNLGYENITIICTNAKIYDYISTAKDYLYNIDINIKLLEEFKNMNKVEKFNLIIANLPYSLGSDITDFIIENINYDSFISLLPTNKYSDEQAKYINNIYLADKKAFVDKHQDILPNLSICEISKSKVNKYKDCDSLNLSLLPKELKDFVELNRLVKSPFTNKYVYAESRDRTKLENNKYRYFAVPYWTHVGIAKTPKSVTKGYNDDIPAKREKFLSSKDRCYDYLEFDDKYSDCYETCWKNLYTLAYKNDVLDNILLNSMDLYFYTDYWFPHIDYSKDRDYEHLTLEDLVTILKEENPDIKL